MSAAAEPIGPLEALLATVAAPAPGGGPEAAGDGGSRAAAAGSAEAAVEAAAEETANGVAVEEACELCGAPLPELHRHVLDLDSGEPQCACRACAVLFDRGEAGGGHYRLIPRRCVKLVDFRLSQRVLPALGIPVELAFVYIDTRRGEAIARYPSPLGLTSAAPAPDAWDQILEANPALTQMQPDVEALLVNHARGADEHWIVSIEDCYRLASKVREHWSGFSGGERVWEEIGRFFAELGQQQEEIAWR